MPEPKTLDALAEMSPREWQEWFRVALARWFSAPERDVRVGTRAWQLRSDAFLPVPLAPDEEMPVARLEANLSEALDFDLTAAKQGLDLLLSDWNVSSDMAAPTAFVLALATQLELQGLGQRIIDILERGILVNEEGKDVVVAAILAAIRRRGSREEMLEVVRLLAAWGWLSPTEAATMLPRLAHGDLDELARLIHAYSPDLFTAPDFAPETVRLAEAIRREGHWTGGAHSENSRKTRRAPTELDRLARLADPAAPILGPPPVIRTPTERLRSYRATVEVTRIQIQGLRRPHRPARMFRKASMGADRNG